FIRYESRFPAEFGCRAEMPAASLIEAVRRVSLVADRASPVRLTFGPGSVTIEAQTEGRGRAAEKGTASLPRGQPAVAFNPPYLLDGITAAAAAAGSARHPAPSEDDEAVAGRESPAGSATVRLQFTSAARPALITLAGDDGEGDSARDAGDSGAERQARPAFRYLVVPLRSPVRAGRRRRRARWPIRQNARPPRRARTAQIPRLSQGMPPASGTASSQTPRRHARRPTQSAVARPSVTSSAGTPSSTSSAASVPPC